MIRFKNIQGFTLVEALLILVILGLVGGVGYYVWNANKNTEGILSNIDKSEIKTGDKVRIYKSTEYKDEVGKFSLQLPEGWTIKSENGVVGEPDFAHEWSSATLTSPKGTEISVQVDQGGRGGGCEPAPADRPHAAGNSCNTEEYLSIEKTGTKINGGYENKDKSYDVLLTSRRVTSSEGKSSYVIGLETRDEVIKLNDPVMGYVTERMFFTIFDKQSGELKHYVYISSVNEKPEFLSNSEGRQVKEILKSFKFI